MNRNDKIRLLQSILEGRLSKRVLSGPKTYLFTEYAKNELYLDTEGKSLTQFEYDKICSEIESENTFLRYLNLECFCSIIITIVFVKGKTIL